MRTLHLDDLKKGIPSITPTFGAFIAEAGVVCLNRMGHSSGVKLEVEGEFTATFVLEWSQVVGKTEMTSWADTREATEYGATAIAMLILSELSEFSIFERMNQGMRFDYLAWSKQKENSDNYAGLEITGIMKEAPGNTIQIRISKKEQRLLSVLEELDIPVFIAAVEFGVPKVKIVKK